MRATTLNSLFLAVLLCAAGPFSNGANAAELFVDNSGSPSCRDSMPGGSSSAPWCTINFAVSRAQAGDVIYVKNGTYRENIFIARKDGGASYITIRNFPQHAPVLLGDGVESGRHKIIDSRFIKLMGFEITDIQQGIFVEGSQNIVLQNLKIHNVGQEAVRIKSNSSSVALEASEIYDTGKWRYNGEGVYIGTSSSQQPKNPPYDNTHDILVRGNAIYNTRDECIEAKEGTYNVTIDGNMLHDCLLSAGITDPNWGAIEIMQPKHYLRSNPNHIIKNNLIRTAKTGIGLHTGATVLNNVILGQVGYFRGISIDNPDLDSYVRRLHGNTISLPSSRAMVVAGRLAADISNNFGLGVPLPKLELSIDAAQ